jgi:hypothetical protein
MKRTRESRETKTANLSTKIEPLPGAIDARFVRCGKANCKCAKGNLHGPYYVRRWREYGKRCSKYVKKGDVFAMKVAVETYRRQRKEQREGWREALRTLHRFRLNLSALFSQGEL